MWRGRAPRTIGRPVEEEHLSARGPKRRGHSAAPELDHAAAGLRRQARLRDAVLGGSADAADGVARAVVEERAQTERVLAAVSDGVVLVDRSGLVRFWNAGAETLTGLAARSVDGARLDDVLPGWRSASRRLAVATKGEPTQAQTVPLEVCGRELWLSVSALALTYGTVYVLRDVSGVEALERARHEFLATASHELRTPLGAVYGAARTLRQRELPDDRRAELLAVIAAQSERLADVVDELLLASRLDADRAPIPLASLDGGSVAREVVARAPARVRLTAADDRLDVCGDAAALRQVLANLVDNAAKYSPPGSPVDVALARDGEVVRFDVHDRGPGIPADERERIFEKFYRLDPDLRSGVGGMGLGLYVSRELVCRMRGRISVAARDGGGSTFSVELPAAV